MVQKIEQKSSQEISQVELEILKERNEEILKINKKARQINEIMSELSKLVNDQGEDIKQIYKSSEKSRDYTKKGLEELKKAKQIQDGEKWRCNIM